MKDRSKVHQLLLAATALVTPSVWVQSICTQIATLRSGRFGVLLLAFAVAGIASTPASATVAADQCTAANATNALVANGYDSFFDGSASHFVATSATAATTRFGTGTNGAIVVTGNLGWQNSNPSVNNSLTRLEVVVNGTVYARLETSNDTSNTGTFIGVNGATVVDIGGAVTAPKIFTPAAVSITLPLTVTQITSFELRFTDVTLNNRDDIGHSNFAALQCKASLQFVKAATLAGGRTSASDQFTLGITGTGANAASTYTTTGSGTTVSGGPATVIPFMPANTYTLTETASANATSYQSTYTCTNASSGTGTVLPSNVSGTNFSITPASGDDITCTITNSKKATVRLVKAVPAGQGTSFDFTQSGMPASATGTPNASTVTAFSLNPSVVSGSNLTATETYTNVPVGSSVVFSELASSNTNAYALTSMICSDAGATGTSFTSSAINNGAANGSAKGSVTVGNIVAGADITCTFNNVRNPQIVINKQTVGGDATFGYTATSSAALTSITPANPTVTTSGGSGSINTQVTGLNLLTTNVTLTENDPTSLGFSLTSLSCINLVTGQTLTAGTTPTATVNVANRQVVLGGVAAGMQLACNFVNQALSKVTIRKTSLGSTGTFNFSGTNGIANQAITTATVGTPQAGTTQTLTTGQTATTVTEAAPPAGFILQSITCTGLGAGGTATPTINGASGGSVLLDAAATAYGSNIVCTFTNTNQADLSITKTNSVTTVTSGTSTTYTLVVNNNGPAPVTGAVVKDAPVSGLTCPAGNVVTCSGTGCPAGPLTMSSLTSGVTMGTMPANTSATFTVTCNVN